MEQTPTYSVIKSLKEKFKGEIYFDEMMRVLYSTDASAYREMPFAVAIPQCINDLKLLIQFASSNNLSLIPRAAGTSLAGQVVGSGIIVDTSKHFTKIIELNVDEKWVRVEPGVVPDELNKYLEPFNLFWGPETSTSNRCKLGGMLGNNSCGAHSLIYGSTRDHTISVKTILSDGKEVEFCPLTNQEFSNKLKYQDLEGEIYQFTNKLLTDEIFKDEITSQFPNKSIKRRNTGYALDIIVDMQPFSTKGDKFNMAKILAGSEGTLAFTTEIKLNLIELPPENKSLVCIHLDSIKSALKANLIALKFKPVSIELMDKVILDLTKENRDQNRNRFFVKGDPGAILIVEFAEKDKNTIRTKEQQMEKAMRDVDLGFHFPIVEGKDISKVWALRKAGLGVLSNMPGDLKPVPVIEDTAVRPEDLPDYIDEFNKILKQYNLSCVYYAHVATGELHLRPIMNLKNPDHVKIFHKIGLETARLVKKYNGSLSGEHGDGRLRGEFIPIMVGENIYSAFKDLKNVWDPKNIFNPGKIVETPPMNTNLRYLTNYPSTNIETLFDFSKDGGILTAAEKCTGSGDCLKSDQIGGTMCPSYMATRDEKNTTRARANILREYLTYSHKPNPFDQKEIFEVLKLCLSCKACKTECPSNVDITKLKAEFLQHYYDSNGIPLKTLLIAYLPVINKVMSIFPILSNHVLSNQGFSNLIKKLLGFNQLREIPKIGEISLQKWIRQSLNNNQNLNNGTIYFFNDEFTKYQDSDIGIKAIMLLNRLGYNVIIPNHIESGRTYLSKGLIRKAKKIANKNIILLKDIITTNKPLIGIEPSAILSFRDEYLDLANNELKQNARELSANCLTIDEFLSLEIKKGKINPGQFTSQKQKIKLHGHCHQKAIGSTKDIITILSLPQNYEVIEIPSACCGMAGSFGFEKDNYELSMKIGEMVLFPEIRKADEDVIIAASGTSCRCQINDGTGKKAFHPVEILLQALV